jgi:putative alpha-1,2-mannosidase
MRGELQTATARPALASFLLILWSTVVLHDNRLFVQAIDHPEDFVNLLAGTFTDGNIFSTGNTLPLVGRPWGFNHWAPQTRDTGRNTGSWWFKGPTFTTNHNLSYLCALCFALFVYAAVTVIT